MCITFPYFLKISTGSPKNKNKTIWVGTYRMVGTCWEHLGHSSINLLVPIYPVWSVQRSLCRNPSKQLDVMGALLQFLLTTVFVVTLVFSQNDLQGNCDVSFSTSFVVFTDVNISITVKSTWNAIVNYHK